MKLTKTQYKVLIQLIRDFSSPEEHDAIINELKNNLQEETTLPSSIKTSSTIKERPPAPVLPEIEMAAERIAFAVQHGISYEYLAKIINNHMAYPHTPKRKLQKNTLKALSKTKYNWINQDNCWRPYLSVPKCLAIIQIINDFFEPEED